MIKIGKNNWDLETYRKSQKRAKIEIKLQIRTFFFFSVIEEGNWLTLNESMKEYSGSKGFDALICMGNSFAHLELDPRWSHLLFRLEF